MLFQANYIFVYLVILATLALIYLIAIYLTRWLAIKLEYSEEWMPAILLNAIWFAVIITLWLLLYLIFIFQIFFFQVYFIIALPANLILGVIAVHHKKLYDIESYKTCFKFVLINLILLFFFSLIGFYISVIIIAFLV